MFNPLGALGSFGSGAVEGFGTGMDLMDRYRTQKGQADFYQALQQSLGDVSSLGPLGTPEPGAPSARAAMPTPQAPAGPMAPGMQPPQAGFAAGLPGAQPVPQQPAHADRGGFRVRFRCLYR